MWTALGHVLSWWQALRSGGVAKPCCLNIQTFEFFWYTHLDFLFLNSHYSSLVEHFTLIYTDMDVSENSGTPKSSKKYRVFHYKLSILGYPYFWKHPYGANGGLDETSFVVELFTFFSSTVFCSQKMHCTAWKLVAEYVGEATPVWDVSQPKSAQGRGCPKVDSFRLECSQLHHNQPEFIMFRDVQKTTWPTYVTWS